jgi:hypothetical protein
LRAVVDYRGCIEMDGRSPVERAAAAFVPCCAGRTTKSAVEFLAALGSVQD